MERAAGAGGFFEGVGVMGSDECQAAVPNLGPLTASAESLSLERLGRRRRRARSHPRALLWPLLGPRSPPARPALRPELSALSLVVLWGEIKRQLSALSEGEIPLFLSLFVRGSGAQESGGLVG